MPSVISANRLEDGAVVYLGDDGDWADTLAAAKLFTAQPELTGGLEAAHRAVASNLVLDPLAVEVSDAPTGWRPMSLRNSIRALGPTVKYGAVPDHEDFGLHQTKVMTEPSDISDVFENVIDPNNLKRDGRSNSGNLRTLDRAGKATQRPTFPHPALEAVRS